MEEYVCVYVVSEGECVFVVNDGVCDVYWVGGMYGGVSRALRGEFLRINFGCVLCCVYVVVCCFYCFGDVVIE